MFFLIYWNKKELYELAITMQRISHRNENHVVTMCLKMFQRKLKANLRNMYSASRVRFQAFDNVMNPLPCCVYI